MRLGCKCERGVSEEKKRRAGVEGLWGQDFLGSSLDSGQFDVRWFYPSEPSFPPSGSPRDIKGIDTDS